MLKLTFCTKVNQWIYLRVVQGFGVEILYLAYLERAQLKLGFGSGISICRRTIMSKAARTGEDCKPEVSV